LITEGYTSYAAIVKEGFDPSKSSNGASGFGAYFADNAKYCESFISHDGNGNYKMFVAKVALGATTKGSTGLQEAPEGFHSTFQHCWGGRIYCVYKVSYTFYIVVLTLPSLATSSFPRVCNHIQKELWR
jgi:hypothetical protein